MLSAILSSAAITDSGSSSRKLYSLEWATSVPMSMPLMLLRRVMLGLNAVT